VNTIDVEATNEKVKKYQQENAQSIVVNQSKKTEEERAVAAKIAEEERQFLARRQTFVLQDQQEQQNRIKERLEFVESLTSKTTSGLKKPSRRKKEDEKSLFVNITSSTVSQTTTQTVTQTTTQTTAGATTATLSYRPAQPRTVPPSQPLAQPMAKPMPRKLQPQQQANPLDVQRMASHAGGFREEDVRNRATEEAFSAFLLSFSPPLGPSPFSLPSLSPIKLS